LQFGALLCAGLAFSGYAKPVLEQVLRSIRKLAAEPTETVGGLREWAVCAPANKSHPLGRGLVAADAERFSKSPRLNLHPCANARNATSLPFLKSGDLSLLTTENKEIQEMQRS
jgi:hypothetical protein